MSENLGALVRDLWEFSSLWIQTYWWVILGVGIIWYTRWYAYYDDRGGMASVNAAISFVRDLGRGSRNLAVLIVGVTAFFVANFVWALEGVGAFAAGIAVLDPTMIASFIGLILSTSVGLGVVEATLQDVLFVMFVALSGAYLLNIGIDSAKAVAEDD